MQILNVSANNSLIAHVRVFSDKICDLATQYLLLATEVGANFF